MRYIRTTNNQIEFIEANDEGKILSSIGLQLGEVYFQIKNKKVAFYLNDSEKPFDNFIWSMNIPITIDGETYEDEDEVSNVLHNIMNDRFQEQLDELRENLAAEVARAEEAEEQLDDKIDDETARAVSAETHLQTEITEMSGVVATFDERITTCEEHVSALTDSLNAEIARSTGKDGEHDAAISGLTNSLNNEISRAQSAETSLHNEILAETSRATSAETNLHNEILAESNRAQAAESGITANLNSEIARATARENAIDDKVDNEITRSTAKDAEHDLLISGLTDDLADEVARATSAETALDNKIDAEIARATSAETALDNKIDAEIARATSAETSLDSKIDNEILRSTNKDTQHDNLISGLTTSLNAEISRATAAENSLRNDLNAEISARTADVDAEEARALAAESAITANLNAEIQNRINAVSGLTERVADDEASTGAALVDLNNKINAVSGENATQAAQISALTTSLNTEISRATSVENALRSDLNAEVSARTTSDNTQNQRLTTIENTLPTKADKVDAVASAEYVSANHIINFKNINGAVISSIDAAPFIKDGMVDNVAIVNGNLVITFNTDAGKQAISIPLTAIFDPANYYNKSEIDASQAAQDAKINTISGEIITIQDEIDDIDIDNYYTKAESDGKYQLKGDYVTGAQMSAFTYDKATIDQKVAEGGTFDPTQYYNKTATDALLAQKQNTLIAGSGILISSNNVISATGGSQPVDAYTKAESDARFQQKLTAGNGISIVNNVISATGGSSTLDVAISGGTDDASSPLAIIYNHPSNVASGSAANAFGVGTKANGGESIAVGSYTEANAFSSFAGGGSTKTNSTASESFAYGKEVETNNIGEAAFGYRNKSNREVNGSTEVSSGCTLFSIGNPHSIQGRDNALEIRKDDSIYIVKTPNSNTKEVVKLQDYLVDPASKQDTLSAGTNVQINNNVISATDTTYTAGDGISISTTTKFWCGTQSQYDAISVKDPNTVYMIHN